MGLPLEWAQAFATVEQMPKPETAESARWEQIMSDARSFMWRCASHAVAAGWSVADAFGYDPEGATSDVGFVLLIDGGRPVVDDEGGACALSTDGKRTWFRIGKLRSDIPMIWNIGQHTHLSNGQKKAKNRG
jgi:hypothetical protein